MKKFLVTGANKGIGFAITERILEEADDTLVFLGSRDADRGAAAIGRLLQIHPNFTDRIRMVEIDVSSDESVRRAAKIVGAQCTDDRLDGIVNNAGIGFGSNDLSSVLNVNTRGIHRTSTTFIPLLADGGRIVNITSASGPNFVAKCGPDKQAFFTNVDVTWDEIDTLMNECVSFAGDMAAFNANGLADGSPYGLSKALANSCTLQLAREHPNLIINACTPGYIATDLTIQSEHDRHKDPEELGMKSPREGANSAIFLLLGDPVGSGHYYGSDAQRSPLDRYRAPGAPPYTGD